MKQLQEGLWNIIMKQMTKNKISDAEDAIRLDPELNKLAKDIQNKTIEFNKKVDDFFDEFGK